MRLELGNLALYIGRRMNKIKGAWPHRTVPSDCGKMSCFCPNCYSTSGDTKVLVPACQGWDKSKLEFVTPNTHEGEPVQTVVQLTDRQLQTEHSDMPQAEHPDDADQPDESILEGTQNAKQMDPTAEFTSNTVEVGDIVSGQWLAVVYDEQWYVGMVLKIDDVDNEVYMTFIKKCRWKHVTENHINGQDPLMKFGSRWTQ